MYALGLGGLDGRIKRLSHVGFRLLKPCDQGRERNIWPFQCDHRLEFCRLNEADSKNRGFFQKDLLFDARKPPVSAARGLVQLRRDSDDFFVHNVSTSGQSNACCCQIRHNHPEITN